MKMTIALWLAALAVLLWLAGCEPWIPQPIIIGG